MPTLPPSPSLDQLRHQAKELLRAANAGDGAAISRIEAVSDRVTLAAAQLALAREYGFASWPKLKDEAEARALALTDMADAFCEASINGRMGRAARLLAETPAIAGYSSRPPSSWATPAASATSSVALRVSRPDSTRAPAGLRFTPSVLHDGIK